MPDGKRMLARIGLVATLMATGPAHGAQSGTPGARCPIRIVYYPEVEVYHYPAARQWYWNDGGGWQSATSLPVHLRQFTEPGVPMAFPCDQPFVEHPDVVRRHGRGETAKMNGTHDARKFTVPLAYPR
jgi:hypothetical protein